MKYSRVFPWKEFLERYLKNHEEFMFLYHGQEYHFSFHDDSNNKLVAELNIGTPATGYENQEYESAELLLENARIEGLSIKEIWDEFQ